MGSDLTYTNEIVFLLITTEAEYDRGDVVKFFDYYLENLETNYVFDIHISFDVKVCDKVYDKLMSYENHPNIKSVYIFSQNIPADRNVYLRDHKTVVNLKELPYGRCHGITYQFYETMRQMFKTCYKNFLLLETDSKPMASDWFDACVEYCNNTDFTIAGSLYKGLHRQFVSSTYYAGHLNGVGLYKNCEKTSNLLNGSKEYIKGLLRRDELKDRKEQKYKQFVAYDVGIYLYGKRHKLLENYNNTDIFVNASSPFDEQYNVEDMLKEFPNTKFFHRKNLYT